MESIEDLLLYISRGNLTARPFAKIGADLSNSMLDFLAIEVSGSDAQVASSRAPIGAVCLSTLSLDDHWQSDKQSSSRDPLEAFPSRHDLTEHKVPFV